MRPASIAMLERAAGVESVIKACLGLTQVCQRIADPR